MKKSIIPAKFQGFLWSREVSKIDPEKEQAYIIHQLLNYGDLEALRWLKKTYSLKKIKQTFLKFPVKIYNPQSLNFVTKIVLNINTFEPANYLKTTPRNPRR